MKIAIIFDGNIVDLKGKVNAILNRVKYIKKIADYEIDVFTLQPEYKGVEKLLWGEYIQGRPNTVVLGGVSMNVIWHRIRAIDNLLSHRLNKKPLFESLFIKSIVDRFSEYDLLSVHSFMCGNLALQVKQRYNIPYCVSWHGSEIHSIPSNNTYQLETTRKIISNAQCNFFVSKALCDCAQKIVKGFSSEILYNGFGESFFKVPDEQRRQLRKQYNVENCKVVSFVGNLIKVKNAQMLPEVFSAVAEKYGKPIKFWIIGDGDLKSEIEDKLKSTTIDCLLWGNQPPEHIPILLQCIDVQVLISKNEGFSLSLVEALACGANAVGSKAGGIVEVLGNENTFEFGENFIDEIAKRIVFLLNSTVEQKPCVSANWKITAEKENSIYRKLLKIE